MVQLYNSESCFFKQDRNSFGTPIIQVREASAFPCFTVLNILFIEIAVEMSFRIKAGSRWCQSFHQAEKMIYRTIFFLNFAESSLIVEELYVRRGLYRVLAESWHSAKPQLPMCGL